MEKESILISIKKLLPVPLDVKDFDDELIMDINSILTILTQMGIGPVEGFTITDETQLWDEFETDINQQSMIRTYVYLRTKKLFDPPTNGTVTQSIDNQLKELEYRLTTITEGVKVII